MSFLKKPDSTIRHVLAAALLLACSIANAQIIDRVDIAPGESEAEIVVQFSQKILYLRHAPLRDGKNLRIFIRLIDTNLVESDLMQETVRAPKTDRVPGVTVLYPELINGMLVTFSKTTSFSVRPGTDGRSIIITVPLLPAAPAPLTKTPPVKQPTEEIAKGASPALLATPAAIAPPPVSQPTETVTQVAKEELATPVAPPPVASAAEVETRAKAYLEDARRAMAGKDSATAVNRLNRVLGLPASSQTEAAQALIGEARELNGEILKAKAEYDLYLKLFPAGPNATRVRERLAALPKDAALARARPRALPKEAGPAEWTFNGSVSSYYYTGKSQIETLVPPPPGQLTFSRDTLSLVDQNSLISSINLNARRRDAFTDTRIVVRDTDNKNFLSPARSYNRLYSAYIDHNDRQVGYYLRAGRQNPNGMGVMDRFDGVQAGYNLNPEWRVNAVYGDAVEFNSPFKKNFYGASVELLPQTGFPGISVYGIEQTLDGMANRRAVGSEVRYFDGRVTAYGMLDYDVLYKGVNIALLQGNYLSEGGDNYFFVFDHRRAPSYSLTNALPAAPGLSLQEMVALQGIDQVRAQASALTAMSDMFSIGVTHPLSESWQVGVDYRLSSISSTQPVMAVLPLGVIGTCLGTIDPVNNTCVIDTASQQASGKNHVVTFQAVGTNLFFTNAVGVANLSLIQAPTYTGQAMGIGYVLPFWEQWRLDTNLRYYTQKDDSGDKQDRISPSLKLSWQWHSSFYLEGEMGREMSNSTGPTRNDHSRRDYVYMGVRWDFH
ncbi:hypothetical protein SCD_n00974 [Sulfuricella denitrificans skB26]|uniref:Uncharacterized protein n=1 Tax=Sulfuricella denitrificans (strain DSM 22764 / NBRC 105220 / skB26) TaxID=1163617 RepID=S6AJT2_SULDS|nr:hypothetical protein [Sulfuricella denitrificans]BAN34814.1 hypothetical protein SCD_n00974 [Sulfuricella denitrificans skB26]